jgi:hypothetical protein
MRSLGLTLAVASAAVALAAQASAANGPTTLHYLDISVGATPAFDAGTGEPRPGDRLYLRDALYHWQGAKRGARAGHAEATLTFMSSFGPGGGATGEITGQLFLAGGSIRIGGIVHISDGPSRFELPVVGGTGRFAGARGSLLVRDLDAEGDRSAFVVRLLP